MKINDILNQTNPNIRVQVANRTFGGTSSAHSSSIVNGVRGGSNGLASAIYFNKGYSVYSKTNNLDCSCVNLYKNS